MRKFSAKLLLAGVSAAAGVILSAGTAEASSCGTISDYSFVTSVTVGLDTFSAYNAACDASVDTWTLAEAFAVSKGGTLASIDNSTINADVEALVNAIANPYPNDFGQTPAGPLAWIGLQQPNGYLKSYNWVNGDPSAYTNWGAGNPQSDTVDGTVYYTFITGSTFSGTWGNITWDTPSLNIGAIVETVAKRVPEPASLAIFGTALLGIGYLGLRRRKKDAA